MKKVSVITLHTVANYGTQLQLFATQEKLKEYFDEVEFIDYRRKDTYGVGLLKTFSKGNFIKGLVVLPTLIYWKNVFNKFRKKYINLSCKKYLKTSDFDDFVENSDAYIVGSDQVWNTGWNKGIIPCLYLDFVKNKPKYSYSASFGKNELTQDEIEVMKCYINSFKKIIIYKK